jgi:hypothetical protein
MAEGCHAFDTQCKQLAAFNADNDVVQPPWCGDMQVQFVNSILFRQTWTSPPDGDLQQDKVLTQKRNGANLMQSLALVDEARRSHQSAARPRVALQNRKRSREACPAVTLVLQQMANSVSHA